jgi:hypothetical protein
MAFHVIEALPLKDQQELTRILGIESTKRTTREVTFYNARAEYLDNRIIELDDDDNILRASGFIVPADGQAGFSKGALFIERDTLAGVATVYENVGTILSCDFRKIGRSSSNIFYTTVGTSENNEYKAVTDLADVAINLAFTDMNASGGGEVRIAP